ncbi:glycoside hydrolase, partial [Candidatus Poribacteria bacterium]
WGDALISRYDVLDWKGFTSKLKEQGESAQPSPAGRIRELMSAEAREAVAEITAMEHPHNYIKGQVTNELNNLLVRNDFYDKSDWDGVELSPEASAFLERGVPDLTDAEVNRLNGMLLESAFPGQLEESHRWGNGTSVKMMEQFAEGGFDRLWLGLDSWQGGYRHPQAIAKAVELGYLIGPYDSYHSIHHPDEQDTWETAQFDLELYETGAVLRADGKKRYGFKQKGYKLSPIVAKPYVEKRVNGIMGDLEHRFNSWFIDCDAYGELYDDYSELHTATQLDGMNARMERIAWIRDAHKTVVGSEGGAAYSASTIHFAHGMMTPVIGWGDPNLKDKDSPYYIGGYWPPDGPAVFVKQVPLKPAYFHTYYDPSFRLPLYQTVFHDSVIATHHWGYTSLKFMDQIGTVALLEMLYQVPPMYHMNLAEFKKHKKRMKAHYDFFSPLHRETGLLPITDFAWLSSDRMVQRTVFGNNIVMVANFGMEEYEYETDIIPGRSIMAKWLDSGKTKIFQPNE